MRRFLQLLSWSLALVAASTVAAPPALVIRPLAERQVADLPEGDLYWQVENFASEDAARAVAGQWSLVASAACQVWLFTLGPEGAPSSGGRPVTTVGPIARVAAPRYLLRINEASGPPGSVTPIHSHPGSEAFYVLAGEQSVRDAHGTLVIKAGAPEAGHGASMAMEVSSSGAAELRSLVMFVVDATRPFSSPASLP